MKSNKLQVWVIRHKKTKVQWRARSGKTSWASSGAAKNAWANTYMSQHRIPEELKPYYGHLDMYDTCKFNDQDLYECVDIGTKLAVEDSELAKLRKLCEGIPALVQGMSMFYNGYEGSIEFCTTDLVYYGKVLGVEDLVSYHGESAEDLEESFRAAVDEFIECNDVWR